WLLDAEDPKRWGEQFLEIYAAGGCVCGRAGDWIVFWPHAASPWPHGEGAQRVQQKSVPTVATPEQRLADYLDCWSSEVMEMGDEHTMLMTHYVQGQSDTFVLSEVD